MNDQRDQRKSKVAAWIGTSALLGGQGAVVRHFGGEMAKGFQTGLGAFLRSGARTAFMSAPPPVKVATGVMIGAGLLAKRPVEGMKSAIELARSKIDEHWKS